jgi:nicotinate-nucleotide adenylyltransferase
MASVKLGVLGGTFDPVHIGHLVLAERAREQLGLERVLWVPAGEPWRKPERTITPAAQRLAMIKLAIARRAAFEVSTIETGRPGPSYSVDTLAALREQRPDSDPVFILGLDALTDLPNWRQPELLIELAALAVAAREGERMSEVDLNRLLPGLAKRTTWVDMPRLDISATELRQRASAGLSIRYLVPDAVADYVAENHLYRAQ